MNVLIADMNKCAKPIKHNQSDILSHCWTIKVALKYVRLEVSHKLKLPL